MISLEKEELINTDGGSWRDTLGKAWDWFGTIADPWYNAGPYIINSPLPDNRPCYYQDVYNHAHGIN